MKSFFKPFLMAATVASIFFVSSCSKTCDPGYEGSDCKTISAAKFYKVWAATETKTGSTTPTSFSVTIGAASTTDLTKINISNFSDVFVNNVTATVEGDKFTIPTQNPDADEYKVVSGSGTYNSSSKQIAIEYTIKNDSTSSTSVWTGTWK